MLALALVIALANGEPPPPAPAATPAAAPSLVDNTVAKALVDEGRGAEAKKIVKGVRVPGARAAAKAADPAADLEKGEELLAKNDAKGALAAFQRALAKAPRSAAPLWGLSRAADAAGDKASGKRYAVLYVKSKAADKTKDTQSAAQWRAEQPDDVAPASAAATPPVPGTATPLSGMPPAVPNTTTNPPASTPY